MRQLKTKGKAHWHSHREPAARRRANPEFVVQALGWVEFHRPAVQWLCQDTADPTNRKNTDPSICSG